MVWAAQRLSLIGFRHVDLAPAYQAERENTREELAVHYTGGPTTLEKWLPPVATVSMAASPFFLWGALTQGDGSAVAGYLVFAFISTFSTALLSSIAHLHLVNRHRDAETEFWERLWVGRLGKAAFKIAGKLLGNRRRQSATTHRATELSLGMAAEQLFQSLPKEMRLSLANLPKLLQRLQGDAALLRKRYEDIQIALVDAGGDATLPEYADIVAMRDETHAKLREAVAALETIRLNLLRLHAGSSTIGGMTATLELAVEVSDDVERLIAGHRDIETFLRFPRESATTPV
jgi:hypothetical protein